MTKTLLLLCLLLGVGTACNAAAIPERSEEPTEGVSVTATPSGAARSTRLPNPTYPSGDASTPSGGAPTAAPTPAAPDGMPDLMYFVAFVEAGDVLNVRAGAGVQHEIVGTLENGRWVELEGPIQTIDGAEWVQITAAEGAGGELGVAGWVNRLFLTQQMNPGLFCDDPDALALVEKFVTAVAAQDGGLFAELTLPMRGLYLQDADNRGQVHLGFSEVLTFFSSTTIYEWGIDAYNEIPVTGTIGDVMLPRLYDGILAETSTQACLQTQEHQNILPLPLYVYAYEVTPGNQAAFGFSQNYYSIFRPNNPDVGQGFDYVGWAIGMEYQDGQPYITTLITYGWIP